MALYQREYLYMYNIPETGWVVELLVTLLQWDPQHCIGTYNMYLSLQQNSKGNYRIFKNLIDEEL